MVILSNSWTKWSINFHFQFILGASGAFKRATTSNGNGYLFLLSNFFINQVGQNRRIKLIHQPMKSIQVPPMCIALKCIFNLKLFYILVSTYLLPAITEFIPVPFVVFKCELSHCLKITQNVSFAFSNFSISTNFCPCIVTCLVTLF